MSRLRIKHRTTYLYSCPVTFGRHRLVVRPREGHDLRVLSMNLHIEPEHTLTWTRDVFGNSVALVDFTSAATQLDIRTDVLVERSAAFPRRNFHEPWTVPFPVTYDELETCVAAAYKIPAYPEEDAALRAWTDRTLPADARRDAEQMMLSLCRSIKTDFQYLRRSEKGVQSPSHTLQQGNGSCRDLATLMLEAVRTLGIAGRFASGYLHCAASDAGRASTHAWMEAYLPALGWRGFDPTLGEPVSEKHVATGVSHHPRGVMPISGRYSGDRADFREMIVEVYTEVPNVVE